MPNEAYANLPFMDRVSEALIEFRVAFAALETNGARVDEIVSFLSENGFGDEAEHGRVVRAAQRLVDDGLLVEKNGIHKLTPHAEEETRRAANLVQKMAPETVPSEAEANRGLTPDT